MQRRIAQDINAALRLCDKDGRLFAPKPAAEKSKWELLKEFHEYANIVDPLAMKLAQELTWKEQRDQRIGSAVSLLIEYGCNSVSQLENRLGELYEEALAIESDVNAVEQLVADITEAREHATEAAAIRAAFASWEVSGEAYRQVLANSGKLDADKLAAHEDWLEAHGLPSNYTSADALTDLLRAQRDLERKRSRLFEISAELDRVDDAVRLFQKNGISLFEPTGDALALREQKYRIGMPTILTGKDIEAMRDEALRRTVDALSRTTVDSIRNPAQPFDVASASRAKEEETIIALQGAAARETPRFDEASRENERERISQAQERVRTEAAEVREQPTPQTEVQQDRPNIQ